MLMVVTITRGIKYKWSIKMNNVQFLTSGSISETVQATDMITIGCVQNQH